MYKGLKADVTNLKLLESQDTSFYAYFAIILMLGVVNFWQIAMVAGPGSAITAGILMGFVSGVTGHLGHDSAHGQAPRHSKTAMNFSQWCLGNLFLGFSLLWWKDKHNQHHSVPNEVGTSTVRGDPDIQFWMLAFVKEQLWEKSKSGIVQFALRHEAILFWCYLPLQAINARISSVRFLRNTNISRRLRTAQYVGIALHFLWYGAVVGYIYLHVGWGTALLFVIFHQGTHGLYNGFVFATNHKGRAYFLATSCTSWLEMQILSSRNVRSHRMHTGVPINRAHAIARTFVDALYERTLTWLYGGLNYQIEHHLFPTMPRCNLRKVRPLVMEFCKDLQRLGFTEFEYYETGVFESYKEVFENFREVSGVLVREGMGA